MSYDLILYPQEGADLTRKAFRAYFREAEHFTLSGDEANYENEGTGVYFHLGLSVPRGRKKEGPRVWFNMNFCRPRFFGREASSVLTALAADLELMIRDEEDEEITDADQIGEELLAQWNRGNEWASGAMGSMGGGEGIYPLPAKTLENQWVWSYQRDDFAMELFGEGLDVFVPRVMYLLHEGRAKSLAVWPNLIPTALPQVDLVYVARDELPEGKRGRRTKMALVPWAELRSALKGYKVRKGGPLPFLALGYSDAEDAPEAVVKYVHELTSYEGKLEGLSADKVLDADLMRPGGRS